ncbi:MAG TPA: hypothetical protein VGW33_15465 [Terriglobia bacterium]|nr:hypothetical protein [Terriglobia bacterium]
MKRSLLVIATMVTLSATALWGRAKKGGEILDQQAFQNIHSYCAQVQDLPPQYVKVVQNFFKHQNKPKSLVNRLPWKMVDDCSQADAAMNFRFSTSQEEDSGAPGGGGGFAPAGVNRAQTTYFQVIAVVTGRASQKPVYQVQGPRAPERGEDALQNTFKELAKDLK